MHIWVVVFSTIKSSRFVMP